MLVNFNQLTIKEDNKIVTFDRLKSFRRELVNRLSQKYFFSYEHYKSLYFGNYHRERVHCGQ